MSGRTRSVRGARDAGAALVGASFLAALAASAIAAPALAAEDDGVYGRMDGDLELDLEAGAAIAEGGPSLALGIGALYLSTAGLYATYLDALGSGAASRRSIAGGVALRPLFLGRFGSNLEKGPATLDLLIDSLSLELGAFADAPAGHALGRRAGLELGLGLALPLAGRASGPFVAFRGALRLGGEALEGRPEQGAEGAGGASALATLSISWRHIVTAHIVDAGDRASRRPPDRGGARGRPPSASLASPAR